MNLQILGAIPHVGSKTFGGDAAAPVIESLRALRLRVLHSHSNGNGPLLLTITSPTGAVFTLLRAAVAGGLAGVMALTRPEGLLLGLACFRPEPGWRVSVWRRW